MKDFLGNTATDGVVSVAPKRTELREPIRLGIVGLGGISRAHLAAADSVSLANAVAGVDPDPAARSKAARAGFAVFESVADMLHESAASGQALHGLVVCTPPSQRLSIIRSGLESGLPILMEKPIAHTLSDAATLVDLQRQFPNVPVRMAFCHRFTPAVIEMKRWIQSGRLGTIIRIDNAFTDWHPAMQESWMSNPMEAGGGSLLDTGSHSVDLVQYLIGPLQMLGMVRHFNWPGRGESGGTMLLAAEAPKNGSRDSNDKTPIAVTIRTGWAEPTQFTISVTGDAGSLSYDFLRGTEMRFQPIEGDAMSVPVRDHEVRFQDQLKSFAELVANPTQDSELARLEDGLAVSRLIQNEESSVVV